MNMMAIGIGVSVAALIVFAVIVYLKRSCSK